ncbi:MAG: hypothetical protein HFF39_04420 [Lawsonibacter sp.]|nr:hypothetical protein [Lawsonibacter sp.]
MSIIGANPKKGRRGCRKLSKKVFSAALGHGKIEPDPDGGEAVRGPDFQSLRL